MSPAISRIVIRYGLCIGASVLAALACAHTGERAVVPSGVSDAARNTPDLADAADRKPIGPIARPVQTDQDYRLIRSPELGLPETTLGSGGSDSAGRSGLGGSNNRPVCTGGGAS
jgi:hypothetical protein